MPAEFKSPFDFRQRVEIDADSSLIGTVTGFAFAESGHTLEVKWIHAGAQQTAWIEHWRLSPVVEH